jgi:hypothetical protein
MKSRKPRADQWQRAVLFRHRGDSRSVVLWYPGTDELDPEGGLMYLSTGTAIIKAFERLAARLGVEMDTVADFPYGLLAYTVCIAHYKMRIVDVSKVCRRQANGTRAHGTRKRHTRTAPQHAHGTHTAYTRHAHGTHTAHAHGTPARTPPHAHGTRPRARGTRIRHPSTHGTRALAR